MANITKYTTQSINITASNIKNADHFKGLLIKSNDTALVPFTGYYPREASAAAVQVNAGKTVSGSSAKTVTLELGAYFVGASNSTTIGTYPSQTIEVRQHNTISAVATKELWVGDSNTITWTDTSNAYTKTANISLSNGSLSSSSLTGKTSGAASVNATTSGLSDSVSSASCVVTVKSTDPVQKQATATWKIKNPINTITPSKDTLAVNAGTNTNTGSPTEGTHGHVSLSAKASNSNGFKIYTDSIRFAGTGGLTVNGSSSVTVASGSSISVAPDGVISAGTSKNVTLTAADGANKAGSKTVTVTISVPTFASRSMNIGESWTADVSSKASGTSVTKVELFSTATGTSAATNASVSSNKIITAKSQGTVYPRFTMSDGAVFRGGTISIAAAINVQILKKDKSSVAADANYGDTLFVKITGGKSGEKFTLRTSDGTLSKTSNVTTNDYVVLTLPKSGRSTISVTVTATPSSGGSADTTSVSVQNITFALA